MSYNKATWIDEIPNTHVKRTGNKVKEFPHIVRGIYQHEAICKEWVQTIL